MAKSECLQWQTSGCCPFGDKCKFTHTRSLRNDRNDKFGQFYSRGWQYSSLIPKLAQPFWRPTREKLSVKDRKEVEAQNMPIKEKVEAFDLASMQLPAPPGPVMTAEALLTMENFSAMDLIRAIAKPMYTSEIFEYYQSERITTSVEISIHAMMATRHSSMPAKRTIASSSDC